ncbi:MAG: hypothetical protein NC293_08030 [Roseburia sp.]|nr:hypothetical protein [Roseburia sp.]
MKELDDNWYYYSDGAHDPDELETYLLENQDGMYVIDFRKANCSYVDSDDIGWDDRYAAGIIFSATADVREKITKDFAEMAGAIPVSTIIERECDFFRVPGMLPVFILLILWGLAVGSGVFWFCHALEKSQEEQRYLAYIGNPPAKLRRWFCSCFVWGVFVMWLISFCAVFLPEPNFFTTSAFWRIYPEIPVVMLLVGALMTFLIYLLNCKKWESRNVAEEAFGRDDVMRLFISELTIFDNLKLILLVQGFKENVADGLVMQMLEEKEIRFLANRCMSGVVKERVVFYELQDRLLEKTE